MANTLLLGVLAVAVLALVVLAAARAFISARGYNWVYYMGGTDTRGYRKRVPVKLVIGKRTLRVRIPLLVSFLGPYPLESIVRVELIAWRDVVPWEGLQLFPEFDEYAGLGGKAKLGATRNWVVLTHVNDSREKMKDVFLFLGPGWRVECLDGAMLRATEFCEAIRGKATGCSGPGRPGGSE